MCATQSVEYSNMKKEEIEALSGSPAQHLEHVVWYVGEPIMTAGDCRCIICMQVIWAAFGLL